MPWIFHRTTGSSDERGKAQTSDLTLQIGGYRESVELNNLDGNDCFGVNLGACMTPTQVYFQSPSHVLLSLDDGRSSEQGGRGSRNLSSSLKPLTSLRTQVTYTLSNMVIFRSPAHTTVRLVRELTSSTCALSPYSVIIPTGTRTTAPFSTTGVFKRSEVFCDDRHFPWSPLTHVFKGGVS